MSADLAIDIADDPDPVAARGLVTYTVTVTNAGPGTATGVIVRGVLVNGRLVDWSGATCAIQNKRLTCDLGSIAAGGSKQFTVTVKARHKPLTATAVVTASTVDPDPSDNRSVEETQIDSTAAPPDDDDREDDDD